MEGLQVGVAVAWHASLNSQGDLKWPPPLPRPCRGPLQGPTRGERRRPAKAFALGSKGACGVVVFWRLFCCLERLGHCCLSSSFSINLLSLPLFFHPNTHNTHRTSYTFSLTNHARPQRPNSGRLILFARPLCTNPPPLPISTPPNPPPQLTPPSSPPPSARGAAAGCESARPARSPAAPATPSHLLGSGIACP